MKSQTALDTDRRRYLRTCARRGRQLPGPFASRATARYIRSPRMAEATPIVEATPIGTSGPAASTWDPTSESSRVLIEPAG